MFSAKAFVPRGLTTAEFGSYRRSERQFGPRTRLDGPRSAPPLETQALANMIVIRCRSGGMADAGDSKSPAPRGLEGSTPSSGTKERLEAPRGERDPRFKSSQIS